MGSLSHVIIPSEPSLIRLVERRQDLSGELEAIAIEDVGDRRVFHYGQTTGYILNDNERMRQDSPDWDRSTELRQVASVPNIVWELWDSMGITLDQKELRKALMRHKEELMTVDKRLI